MLSFVVLVKRQERFEKQQILYDNWPSSAPWILHSIRKYDIAAKSFQHLLNSLQHNKN